MHFIKLLTVCSELTFINPIYKDNLLLSFEATLINSVDPDQTVPVGAV